TPWLITGAPAGWFYILWPFLNLLIFWRTRLTLSLGASLLGIHYFWLLLYFRYLGNFLGDFSVANEDNRWLMVMIYSLYFGTHVLSLVGIATLRKAIHASR